MAHFVYIFIYNVYIFRRGFAPYAILIFHTALKTTYFTKFNEVHFQKNLKMLKMFEFQLEKKTS